METIFSYIKKTTKTNNNLADMPWQDIVDKVILPQMAGHKENRWRIGDQFMQFMALYAQDVLQQDYSLGCILLEIALQRISNGAVLHEDDPTPTTKALPQKYWEYASTDEPGLMSEACFDFIAKALPIALKCAETKKHALAIAFGLLRHIRPNGEPRRDYCLGYSNYQPDGKLLYSWSRRWVEEYASEDELFRHYAKPEVWIYHKDWLAKLAQSKRLDWENFFKETGAADKGNFLQRWQTRRKVKESIRLAGMAVAGGPII